MYSTTFVAPRDPEADNSRAGRYTVYLNLTAYNRRTNRIEHVSRILSLAAYILPRSDTRSAET